MEVSSLQTLLQFRCAIRSPSCMDNEQPTFAVAKNLQDRFHSLTVKRVPRRLFLQFIGLNPIILYVNPVVAAPIPEMKEPDVIRTQKLASGVRIQDIVEGEGLEAHEGDLVELNYVCRRSNGYFVHSTVDQFNGGSMPVILPLDENQISPSFEEMKMTWRKIHAHRHHHCHSLCVILTIIKGLKEVLVGMRVGGKRRALIPPAVGYVNENLKPIPDEFGPRRSLLSHANEPLIFEVQLLKVL